MGFSISNLPSQDARIEARNDAGELLVAAVRVHGGWQVGVSGVPMFTVDFNSAAVERLVGLLARGMDE